MSTFDPAEWRRISEDEVASLELAIEEIVEGWFLDSLLDREELADRLEGTRLPDGKKWELPDQWDDPVMVAVLKLARRIRKECLA